ncbi:MAG: hypothetical protein V4450_07215 [Bacteroidota bacterium]
MTTATTFYEAWQLDTFGNVLQEQTSPLQVEEIENGFADAERVIMDTEIAFN